MMVRAFVTSSTSTGKPSMRAISCSSCSGSTSAFVGIAIALSAFAFEENTSGVV